MRSQLIYRIAEKEGLQPKSIALLENEKKADSSDKFLALNQKSII